MSNEEPGYLLHVSDRTAAAMQLAAHFTAEAMKASRNDDPRARLAEQLGYFDLAFRSIMGSTARGIIKSGPSASDEVENGIRARVAVS